MKIHIVNYEEGMGIDGILTKYAKEMERALIDLGHKVTRSYKPDKNSDINHHINYYAYIPSGTRDTTMITHITGDMYSYDDKVKRIKETLKTSTGICFNQAMKDKLIKLGCPKEKLEVVLSAHDSIPRRPRIIAICSNLYPDGRKREKMFEKMAVNIKDYKKIIFRIMGKGWQPILDKLTKKGLQVQWLDHFDKPLYEELLATSDYLFYPGGEDALAQSILDAKQAGLRIISAPQSELEVEYPFETQEELNSIFSKMEENPVEDWTWENYAKAHLKIWKRK